jgi:hypothetical protein
MRRLWHRYVLGHRMVGPHERGDYHEWHDLACGEFFRGPVFRPRPDMPPM